MFDPRTSRFLFLDLDTQYSHQQDGFMPVLTSFNPLRTRMPSLGHDEMTHHEDTYDAQTNNDTSKQHPLIQEEPEDMNTHEEEPEESPYVFNSFSRGEPSEAPTLQQNGELNQQGNEEHQVNEEQQRKPASSPK